MKILKISKNSLSSTNKFTTSEIETFKSSIFSISIEIVLAMGLRSTLNDYNIPLVIVYGYGSKVRFDRILEDNSTEANDEIKDKE